MFNKLSYSVYLTIFVFFVAITTSFGKPATNIKSNLNDSLITLQISKIKAQAGDSVEVPINVYFPTDSAYSSLHIEISGFGHQAKFLGLNFQSSLLKNKKWKYQYNKLDSVLYLSLAGSQNISGQGNLFNLRFNISDTASGQMPLHIKTAQFDESSKKIIFEDGLIDIINPLKVILYGDVSLNNKVSSYDASLILKYLVKDDSLNKQQILNGDVTADSSISTLDASLILQYTVQLLDGLPISDQQSDKYLASADVFMSDEGTSPGHIVKVPIYLKNTQNIMGCDNILTYDTNMLEFDTLTVSSDISNLLIASHQDNGKIHLAAAGTLRDTTNILLTTLKFKVKDGFSGSTKVALKKLKWNEQPEISNVTSSTISLITPIERDESKIPTKFSLKQNYPNPFNPTTNIKYNLPENTHVKISIYDINGHLIELLINKFQHAGYHTVNFNGYHLASGFYLYKIKAGSVIKTKKMLLLK